MRSQRYRSSAPHVRPQCRGLCSRGFRQKGRGQAEAPVGARATWGGAAARARARARRHHSRHQRRAAICRRRRRKKGAQKFQAEEEEDRGNLFNHMSAKRPSRLAVTVAIALSSASGVGSRSTALIRGTRASAVCLAQHQGSIITILTCSRWKGLRCHVLWLLGGSNRRSIPCRVRGGCPPEGCLV